MMGGSATFRYFVLAQVSLILSYFLWRLSARWTGVESRRAGARRWVTLGRIFVAASLASPLLCAGLERFPLSSRWLPETPLAGRLLGEADGPGGAGDADANAQPARLPAASERSGFHLESLLLTVWAAGALATLAFRGFEWCRLGLFLAEAAPLRREGRVEVLVHPEPVSPFAVRTWKRAIVILPAYLVATGRWRDALRHEMVHHERGDTRWALAWGVLTALLWANPVAWLWRRRMGELQEMACDEQLLECGAVSPGSYGKALLDVAEATSSYAALRMGACASMAGGRRSGRSALARRLDRILNHTHLERLDRKPWFAWALAGACLWAVMAAAWAAGGAEAGPRVPEMRLEADLQDLVSKRLSAHLERTGARQGVVVVMDPATGAVLSKVGFRRDEADREIVADEAAPFTVRFPGASTMKTLVVAGALHEGAVSASDVFDTGNGTMTLDGQTYHEWKEGGLGKVTLSDVLVKSSNLGAIQVAQRLGAERLAGFLGRLGYEVTPGASVAELSCGYSENLSVSAHQMAYAYAVLANGGRDPRSGAAVVRPEVSDFIRKSLVRAVEKGTGSEARCEGLVVGGKTGTSIREIDGARTGTAYFVGFAPADDPRMVISVVVDELGSRVNGNLHAASLFREIVENGLPMLEKAAIVER